MNKYILFNPTLLLNSVIWWGLFSYLVSYSFIFSHTSAIHLQTLFYKQSHFGTAAPPVGCKGACMSSQFKLTGWDILILQAVHSSLLLIIAREADNI